MVTRVIRRGLPRARGGEPWPPADVVADGTLVAPTAGEAYVQDGAAGERVDVAAETPTARIAGGDERQTVTRSVAPASAAVRRADADGIPLRRGLPRIAGGEPWPPAGIVTSAHSSIALLDETTGGTPASPTAVVDGGTAPESAIAHATPLGGSEGPLPFARTVWQGQAPRRVRVAPASDTEKFRPTWPQAIAGLFAAAGLGIVAAATVAFVRTLLSLDAMEEFLAAFPGHYEPAIHVEPGFAPWVGWQHFFNMFLMVLIIRSGLTIRHEKRPTAFWAPKNDPKGKVSLTIWFHQALDILWLVNGVIFVVLLFVTGHWVRIVPTSWEVLPNALSAALQYVSLDWPTENGWNNYNSLQQLAYFVTVFLAAPLAAMTGVRMSKLWPKNAERLSRAYPIEWARRVHFPVMLYFVLFIIAHVTLVFLTGMLRNLNHIFASSDAIGWTGFWVFVAAMAAIVAGWGVARPLVIAPIAKLFGTVSGR
ncbi:MAG: cytochrome b/b6 domain-containing protein [Microbacterium sp.]